MSENSKLNAGALLRTIPRTMYLRMFYPSLISAVALAMANIADALVVGNRVGETGLATIGLATPVFLFYSLLGTGFASGGGITHARLTATEERDRALCHCRQLCAGLLLIGIALALLGNIFMEPLLSGLGAGEDVPELRKLCGDYVKPLVTAAPLFMLNFLLYFFVRSDDNPRLASLGFSIGSILDLALNILLVIVMDKGVKGAIYATIIAQAVSVLILSVHLFSRKKGILHLKAVLTARAEKKNVTASCRESMKIGFSGSVSYLFQFLFMLLGNHLLMIGESGTSYGELRVAVFDLVMNCSYVTTAIYQAAAEAVQPVAATFSAEHDHQSLHYLLKTMILSGLIPGLILAGVIAVFAGPIATVFGLAGPMGQALSIHAVRVFLLSTPFAGILIMLISMNQSTDQVRTAALGTLLRNAIILLPVTLALGLLRLSAFWWLFPVTEGLSLLILLSVQIARQRKKERQEVPVISRTITNDNKELDTVMEAVEQFCEANEVPAGITMKLRLAVEELCAVTMIQAFSGKPGEYIQVTLAAEEGQRYVLHIRNSAPYFNPLDMRMERAKMDMTAEIMDSIGVMMVQKRAKSLNYRNYQGYNVMTVEY